MNAIKADEPKRRELRVINLVHPWLRTPPYGGSCHPPFNPRPSCNIGGAPLNQ